MKQKYKYSNVLLNSLLDPKGFNLQEKFTKDSPELWIISHEHYKEIFSTKTIIKEPQKYESESKKEYRFSKTKGNENNYSQEDKSGVRIQYSNIQGNEGTIQRERKYYKYSNTSGNNLQFRNLLRTGISAAQDTGVGQIAEDTANTGSLTRWYTLLQVNRTIILKFCSTSLKNSALTGQTSCST